MFTLILFIIGFFTVLDSSASLGMPFWRETYGLVFILTSVAVLAEFCRKGIPRVGVKPLAYWLCLNAAWLGLIALQPVRYPEYIAGDFAGLFLPAMFYYLYLREYGKGTETVGLKILFFCTLFGAVIAPLVGNHLWGAQFAHRVPGAFKPPHIFLISAVVLAAFNARNRNWRVAYSFASAVVFVLAFVSSQRTNAILFLIGLAIVIFQRCRVITGKMVLSTAVVVIVGGGLLIAALNSDRFNPFNLLEGTRYETLNKEGGDDSLQGRLDEAHDIFNVSREESSFLHLMLGYGHGATFEPFHSKEQINLTDEYRIHNIHIGPAMLFYRYGAVGAGLFLLLGCALFRDILRSRRMAEGPERDWFIFYLNMTTLFYINSFMRTSLNDPLFSLGVAGYLAARTYRVRRPRASAVSTRAVRLSPLERSLQQLQQT